MLSDAQAESKESNHIRTLKSKLGAGKISVADHHAGLKEESGHKEIIRDADIPLLEYALDCLLLVVGKERICHV